MMGTLVAGVDSENATPASVEVAPFKAKSMPKKTGKYPKKSSLIGKRRLKNGK
jgi:hypothetical protein